jgi:transcriptional/translational regulatory protein YebC/TACO1
MFDRLGVITYPAEVGSAEEVFEAAVEAGASNVESSAEQHEITCDPDDFSTVRDALTEKFGDPREAELTWRPQNTVEIDEDKAQTMLKLLDTLDDSDDVQRVSANFDISDDVMARLTA